MKILIYVKNKNIKEIARNVSKMAKNIEIAISGNNYAKLFLEDGCRIEIKKMNEGVRGDKSRIILYDGDFTHEEKMMMESNLVNSNYNLQKSNIDETLLAPIEFLPYVLPQDEHSCYLITDKTGDIKLITKDIIKALNYVYKIKGCIYCFENEKFDDIGLWALDCEFLNITQTVEEIIKIGRVE